ncbi:ARID/BRIGHT DNA-binding domain,ELM2 domain protein, putative isoform 1 [Hibiscus syriacus]|uniref:ARID/BRIGHT DNA-binding domain,ELM2 domain protein, putative isoform 1 n=1 Tax=Hibiscus syriacus TaxID=106335 RepID=A0A6A2WFW1_HIBSY|nr:ARID/BRIGHT DNA-binding domain,ELM2 domain protein, putative isoform 1 [Hibiscus syriacus]
MLNLVDVVVVAFSVRVSNELRSAHPRAAKYSVVITVIQSLVIGILSALLNWATRNKFAVIFTENIDMQKGVARLAYLLCITMVLNSVQQVISGVAVGGGWQALGIWTGMICGTLLQTIILLYIIYKTNWNTEVEQASERIQQWGAEMHSPAHPPNFSD